MNETLVENLRVRTFASLGDMAEAAAHHAATQLKGVVQRDGAARVAFAAAPSQTRFLEALRRNATVPWASVVAFHLDEYLGLPREAPQHFRHYLEKTLFDQVTFKEVHTILPTETTLTPEAACERYDALLGDAPLHLTCLGIGENGHLAFNDPPAAFGDTERVKIVELERACREQQVHDGTFATLAAVPRRAVTLTIPALMAAETLVCVVPGERKRAAVRRSLYGPVTEDCPASILRRHPDATLYLDAASGAALAFPVGSVAHG